MKRLLLISVFALQSIFCFSQNEEHPYGTTIEEYNYVTKGYAVQIEQGLDMKAGYEFASLNGYGEWGASSILLGDGTSIKVELELLMNNSKPFPERAVMVIMNYEEVGFKRYLCIPNNYSNDLIWNKYFDEIKYFDSNDLLALTWALSKSKAAEALFCFPENSLIKLVNGSEKEIQKITKGDTVSSYNFEKQTLEYAVVDELLVHSNKMFEISKINISVSDNLTASLNDFLSPRITLEATNNHPVFTNNGIKNFGDLDCNDKIYFYSKELQKVILCNVTSIEKNIKSIAKVYNLKLLNSDNFIVNGTIVKTK